MSRWPVALLCVGLLGTRAAAQTPQTITVESPTLKADQPIPRDYTADGRNVSPPLTWSGRAGRPRSSSPWCSRIRTRATRRRSCTG